MLTYRLKKAFGPIRRVSENFVLKIARHVRSDYVSGVLRHAVHHRRVSLLVGQDTFSERIVLRNARPQPMFERLSDKYEVRAFVRERVGSDYLIPLFGVVDRMSDFDFSTLPDAFVMKATHGSGWVRLVDDQHTECLETLRKLAGSWLNENFYPNSRESHYKLIPPRIMFEQLLLQDGVPVDDYKIHCFRKNGRLTQILQIHSDRFGSHKVNFFSADWQTLDLSHGFARAPTEDVRKPEQLEHLLEVADRLSTGMNYVRVDLYVSSGRVYFGELTFTPGAGLLRFQPQDADHHWAALFDKDDHSSDPKLFLTGR